MWAATNIKLQSAPPTHLFVLLPLCGNARHRHHGQLVDLTVLKRLRVWVGTGRGRGRGGRVEGERSGEIAVVAHLQPPAERARRQRSKEMGKWASPLVVLRLLCVSGREGSRSVSSSRWVGGRGEERPSLHQIGNPRIRAVIPSSEQHTARATLVDCYPRPSIHPPTQPPAR